MTSVMLKPEIGPTIEAPGPHGMARSILLHICNDAGQEARLQAALALTRATDGHLSCVQASPIKLPVGIEPFGGGAAMAELMKIQEREAAVLRARIEDRLGSEDVAWTYEQYAFDPAAALIEAGALADLVIVGRAGLTQGSAANALASLGEILRVSRTPLLICPDELLRFDPLGLAAVAWNGSFEAANALRAALPLLKMATSVHLVAVDEQKDCDFPSLGALEYLSRHDIHAEMIVESRGTLSIADRIVNSARSLGASYLVMGAYGHSRVRENLFGGVTRSLLLDCPIPLVAAR